MSRIGKIPIKLPNGVEVKQAGTVVTVKGPKGTLSQEVTAGFTCKVNDGEVITSVGETLTAENKARWGLYRMLVENMIVGVTQGYAKTLEIVGVGYKAELKGKDLTVAVGLSHTVIFSAPQGITFTLEGPTKVTVAGINKQLVGQIAADIRKTRKPEPYKGKGVRYTTEKVRRKVGKAGSK